MALYSRINPVVYGVWCGILGIVELMLPAFKADALPVVLAPNSVVLSTFMLWFCNITTIHHQYLFWLICYVQRLLRLRDCSWFGLGNCIECWELHPDCPHARQVLTCCTIILSHPEFFLSFKLYLSIISQISLSTFPVTHYFIYLYECKYRIYETSITWYLFFCDWHI